MFQQASLMLEIKLLGLWPQFDCTACQATQPKNLKEALVARHQGCGFISWQKASLNLLKQELGLEILERLQAIERYKNTFSCHMCGMCCRMASADADYDTLRQRAAAGDEFSQQFTSVFLPYESRDKAREVAPDVVSAVLAEAAEEALGEERIYFYHCPYLGEDNRCSVYGTDKRPGICASYPETPLSFVYKNCAWKPWKDETHETTLLAHILLALCTDLSQRLESALSPK